MAPTISICIAHYNGIELIDACIASVRAQAGDFLIEIVVHDDASPDDSVKHIREKYPDVKLIASTENVGFCIANNRMAVQASGEFLLLLNNDATLLPDALAALLTEARQVSHPAILTLPQYDAETGELLDMGGRLDPFLNPVPNRDPACSEVGTVHGACLWIPRALWMELGGFPEWFGSVGEDLYLCCRARLAGYSVRAIGNSGYRHLVGQSFGGGRAVAGRLASTFRRRALSERNKTFVMAMIYPAPLLGALMPLHFALLLLEGILLSLLSAQPAYLTRIYLPVFASMWHEFGAIGRGRREAMAARRIATADFLRAFDPMPYKLRMLLRYGLPRMT